MAAPTAQHVSQSVRTRDLASVALKAATELDNLIRHQHTTLDGLRDFAEQLSSRVVRAGGAAPASLLDPTTTIVLGRAVGDASGSLPQQVNDVTVATEKWIVQMSELIKAVEQAEDIHPPLANLRSFCLAVSIHATAMSPKPFDRPDHPFRRLRA